MESILFDSYRKYQKEQKDNFIKAIFKLPVWVQIFLAMIVLCLVYSVLVLFVPCLRVVYGYCLAVEVLTCVALYFYTENFQIKTSDSRLFVYQEYCEKIKHWLDSVGVNVTPENITEIMTRTNKRIDMLEKKRKERRDIKLDNPTLEELTEWYNKSGLPIKKFFNTSGLLYKSLDLKNKLPEMSEDEMLKLLATDGMLIKRPLFIGDNFVLVGFKEYEWEENK